MQDLSGQSIKGYDLLERIGAGGFGVVYRAYQSAIGREVAIKIILPEYANQPDFIRRFETEARLVARLEHPYIVPLIDFWRDPDGAYLVMRLLRGGNLKSAIQQGVFSVERTAQVLDQVASALELTHRSNIVHLDIKPSNILLDEDGNAYLGDFGIAKVTVALREDVSNPDAFAGSLDYIAPEQARGEEVTAQTDIYNLGVMLYEMLTGEHPFKASSTIERMYKHLNDPLPDLTFSHTRAAEINKVIQKATAKKPADRYEDVLTLAKALREAAGLQVARPAQNVIEQLTLREHEVLQGIVDGLSNNEIAEKLVLTVGTVKWYVNQIYKKLGVHSRVQARVRARELDLLGDSDLIPPSAERSVSVALPEPENPYKGLRPFRAADHLHFFGREALVEKMIDHLGAEKKSSGTNRFLAVVGPSGSGKSSVVLAGLVPALWRGDLPGSEKWFVVDVTPGAYPLEELEIGLMRVAAHQTGSLMDQLQRDMRGLVRSANLILPDDESELLLVIDQFEELFTLVEDEEQRSHFLDLLYTAVTDVRSRVRVVVTLRADFYDRPLYYPEFGALVRENLETVMPLSAEELERAITRPAADQSVTFEPGLVSTIIDEISYQPGALPLLQYGLTELFDQRDERVLTHQAYQKIGGVVGALPRRAEDLYSELGSQCQDEVRQMFLRLVTLGEGVEDTRRRVDRSELAAIASDAELMDEMIDLFADYRLLSLDHDPTNRRPTVEVAHEALLREWERLRGWLNERREDIRSLRLLNTAARHWRTANQDESYLLSGSRLAQFEGWAQATDVAMTLEERQFLETSIEEERLQQARQRRLRNAAIAIMSVVIILVSGLALWANAERGRAELAEQAARRQVSIGLAAQTMLELENGNQDVAILLALEALDQYPYTAQAESALAQAVEEYVPPRKYSFGPELLSILETTSWSPDGGEIAFGLSYADGFLDALIILEEDTGSEKAALSLGANGCVPAEVDWSPEGDQLVSSYKTGFQSSGECLEPPRVWDIKKEKPLFILGGHEGPVNSVDWSPGGSRILTAGDDGQVIIWDAATGEEALALFEHTAAIKDARWSPAGDRIVIASLDGAVRILDAESARELLVITSGPAGVIGLDWSSDGGQIAAAGEDGLARIFDTESGALLLTLIGHDGVVSAVGYSPDGRRVATLSNEDQTTRIWDAKTGALLLTFPYSGGLVEARNVTWSPDGNWFTFDGEREIWDVSMQSLMLFGHTAQTRDGEWSPDGRLIATASFDNTARIWDASTGKELFTLAHPDRVWFFDWAPDGSRIVTSCADGTARTWDVTTGEVVLEVPLESTALFAVRWSPDGTRIVNSGFASRATVWDADTGETITNFGFGPELLGLLDEGEDFCVLFGPSWSLDSERISTGCIHSREIGTGALIWDAATGELLMTLDDLGGGTGRTEWLFDGTQMISSHGSPNENVLRLWDLESGDLLQTFTGHDIFAYGLSVSPDGKRVASGDMNGVVKIWDLETRAEVLSFQVVGGAGNVHWSPDGSHVIVTGGTGTPVIRRVWPSTQALIDHAYGCCVTRDLTAEERLQFGLLAAE
ncbi:MAG: protein kinase [Chloroflexota bacterium]